MSTYYWGFWYAFIFLSRVPGPYLKRIDQDVERAAMWFYPVVGGLLGILAVSLVFLCYAYNPQAPTTLIAALVLALWVYYTGAMHLDGIADTADAWVGGLGNHERTLEIMKDPRIGAMGTAAMSVVVVVKLAAIAALVEQFHSNKWLVVGGLLLIPMFSRAGILGLIATTQYVRKQGMVSNTQSGATKFKLATISLVLILLSVVLLEAKAVILIMAWLIILALYRRALIKRLGGYTGDTLGASVEIQEVLLLVVLAL